MDPNPIGPTPGPRCRAGQGGFRGFGPKKQAKIFGEAELRDAEMQIRFTDRAPESALVMLLLSYFAGLRPCEIANLRTRTLLDGSGELLDYIEILPGTTKRGTRRVIPMHPRLREALLELFRVFPNAEHIAYRRDINGFIHYRSAAAVCQWFCKIYLEAGLRGCTGMSGRRSFATRVWEGAKKTGASILDVKDLLGHVSLSSTQHYIERKNNSRAIIDLL